MLYIDYHFDIEDGYLKFDEELHISSQEKKPGQVWGSLPPSWKEGDVFKLTLVNDRVVLVKELL